MKAVIRTHQFVRQEGVEKEFELPDVESYYFETGIRRSVRLTPIYTTWHHEKGEPEIIFQYHVTIIYLSMKNKVESFKLSALSGLSELYNMRQETFRSEQASIVKALVDKELDPRTKEQFEGDLRTVWANINQTN